MTGRVLVLSYYYPPFNGPGTQHGIRFARFLPHFGFESAVLSCSVYYGENTDNTPCPGTIFRAPLTESGRRWMERWQRVEMKVQDRLRLWEHGVVWVPVALREARRLMKSWPFQAVISVSPSIASHLAALRIKKRFPKVIWVADFQDPFVGNPFRIESEYLKRFQARFEADIFANADILSANTDTVREMWASRYPQYAGKMTVTWGGWDPDEGVGPLPVRPRERPHLSHVGAIYGGRIPNAFLESLHRLVVRNAVRREQLEVVFLGPHNLEIARKPEIVRDLVDRGWLRIHADYIPRTEALRVAAESDYSLLLDITEPHNTSFQVPSKVFDQILIGRPILSFTPRNSPTARILSESGIPHVNVDTRAQEHEVDEALLRFLEIPSGTSEPSRSFLDRYSARTLTGNLAGLIHDRL